VETVDRKGIERLVALMAIATSVFAIVGPGAGREREAVAQTDPSGPDLVLIVLDDGRRELLRYMPNVRRHLIRKGIEFTNGYVVNPVCCPSRASILTGLYSHSTGVYTNRRPDGGFDAFRDGSTIATWLHAAGYRTALIGKYLNQYGPDGYVPPGWDRWFATFRNGGYFDYAAVSDGETMHFGEDRGDYGTTVLASEAVSFIRETAASDPLFLYLTPHAPHEPATPERRDRDSFAGLPPWRPPSYDERDLSDKPAHMQDQPTLDAPQRAEIDAFRIRQIQALQSVDRMVGRVVRALRETGRLDDTLLVFTSDNGMLWGEHRLFGKSEIYEEAVGVPFVVRYDPMIEEARSDEHLVLNIDFAPTLAELAGVEPEEVEGRSLLPLLRGSGERWRHAFLIEHMGKHERSTPTFCAIHTARYVLVRFATGEEELYDLVRDPSQMTNRVGRRGYRSIGRDLRSELRGLCDPEPPGFSF
jgi:arylsulfatase A-like enzyme